MSEPVTAQTVDRPVSNAGSFEGSFVVQPHAYSTGVSEGVFEHIHGDLVASSVAVRHLYEVEREMEQLRRVISGGVGAGEAFGALRRLELVEVKNALANVSGIATVEIDEEDVPVVLLAVADGENHSQVLLSAARSLRERFGPATWYRVHTW